MTQAQQLANLSQAYTAGALGFRNRFINGDCRITQRGNDFAIPANNPVYGTADRIYYYSAGSTARSYSGWQTPSGRQATRMMANAAGNTAMAMGQRIEQANCWDLGGQLVTATAWMASEDNANPTFSCAAFVWNSANNPSGGGVWVPSVNPMETLLVSGGWRYMRARFNLPANASNGFALEYSFPAVANGKSNAIGDLQLERGYINTPFEQRDIGLEQVMCSRYYQIIGQLFTNGYGGAGASIFCHVALPVTMRIPPGDPVISQVGKSNSTDVVKDSGGTNFLRVQSSIVATGNGWAAASVALNAEL